MVISIQMVEAENGLIGLEPEELVLQNVDGLQQHILQPDRMTLIYFAGVGCKYCDYFEERAMHDLYVLINKTEQLTMKIIAFGDSEEIEAKYHALATNTFFGTSQVRDMFQLKSVPSFFLLSADGRIWWTKIGFPPHGDIEELLPIWEFPESP